MSKIAIYSGTFDPLTNGHLHIIKSAAEIFDKIIVAIGVNPNKTPLLSLKDRQEILVKVCQKISECKIEVISFEGLVVEAALAHDAKFIIRGLRDGGDFNYEMQMAGMNSTLAPHVQTVFLPSASDIRHINSTLIRQIAKLGGDITPFVPKETHDILQHRIINNL